ncbi:MAG: serine/threonine protein kinase, partial [Spirulinaceae cyanobacterium]
MMLHQRYGAIALLSKLAYGATYLAQDQGRFNELCILKELNLSHLSSSDFAEARDRFLNVANQLYRLKHRQIPAFRATFTQEQRLFFVQDYIEGQSLEDIWQARQSQNRTLTETEVRELCQRLLPILDYLHRQNFVSGNINPAHIIVHPTLATPNHLEPVLIGLDARWACLPPQHHPYSPPEQRQGDFLTPSSDLYSLAATAVVVLTGQNPETLYDSASETWHWQDQAEVSDDLAAVFQRMLQPNPRDRYGCALDVLQALQPPPN